MTEAVATANPQIAARDFAGAGMRAAVYRGAGRVVVEPVPVPEISAGEILIHVAACGICGTDLHILEGEFAPSLPIIPGHEFTGVVVATGSDVHEIASGQRVAVDPSLYCFECHFCKIGHNNLCERWNAIGVSVPGGPHSSPWRR